MFKNLATSRGSIVNKAISACLFILLISLFTLTNLTSVEILFWILFIAMFAWNIDSRVALAGALVFLTIIPLFTIFDRLGLLPQGETLSESIAVWVFYFLAIGVLKQLWDTVLESKKVKVAERPHVTIPIYIPKTRPTTVIEAYNRVKKIYSKHDVVAKRNTLVNTKEKQ
jgi:hypothetical protein